MSEAYEKAGVNIQAGYEAVERMKRHVQRTMRPEVLSGLGGFGAMFELPVDRYRQPVLVSGTDGVGTKLKMAFALNRHDTIGQDVVAMCVNDIVVQGAEPLYFLDYLSCGRLIPEQAEDIVKGIADGCEQAGCALIGGETAEMPGFYPDGEYDLAGFGVGVVEKEHIIDGSKVREGDILIGLPSNGVHSNGFSLVRKVLFEQAELALDTPFTTHVSSAESLALQPEETMSTLTDSNVDHGHTTETERVGRQRTLGEILLEPTRIYVQTVLKLLSKYTVTGMAHITGGGLYENIPRMLPKDTAAEIEIGRWPVPPVFSLIQEKGNVPVSDMYHTFNMGLGLVMAFRAEEADAVLTELEQMGEKGYPIGQVIRGERELQLRGL